MGWSKGKLWQPSKRWYALGIPLGGYLAGVLGIALWGGFNAVVELTNTESFCISCHEMRDTVYQEYQQSPHFKTGSGVIASCPDCHVPKPLLPKLVAKVKASADIYHTLMGTIDTPEKFNARRKIMADKVWATMEATDSRECRSCHLEERMALEMQDKRTRKKHRPERMASRGETCIDCHKGIAHELPDEV
ncbi:MAG: NapC/NirT family cytochrome c [Halopseudomonas sp.]